MSPNGLKSCLLAIAFVATPFWLLVWQIWWGPLGPESWEGKLIATSCVVLGLFAGLWSLSRRRN